MSPDLTYGGWMVAFISFLMLFLTQRLGTVGALMFMVPWAFVLGRLPGATVRSVVAHWPLLSLPALAMLSTVWSDYPAWSLRGGTQYLATTVIGIIAVCCVKYELLLSSMLSALAIVTVLSLIDGSVAPVGLTGEYAIIGLFGSKNYFAFCVSLFLLIAPFVTLDRQQPRVFRLLGLAALVAAPPVLLYAKSAGALAACGATLATALGLAFIARVPVRSRAQILGPLVILASVVACLPFYFADLIPGLLESIGKDATLTGRTFLWDRAADLISERPLLGVGYQAFWQPDNTAALNIMQYLHLVSRTGFYFHNTYLQVAVDLGVVGVGVLLTLLGAVGGRMIVVLFNTIRKEQIFGMSMLMFLLMRSPLEVVVFYQFEIGSVIMCMVWIYVRDDRASASVAGAIRPAGSLRMPSGGLRR